MPDPASVASGLALAGGAASLVKDFKKLLDEFKGLKPDVKSLRIDYRDRSSEMRMTIRPESGLWGGIKKVELPAVANFEIGDVFDRAFNRVPITWTRKNGKWIAKSGSFPNDDTFLVTMKGQVGQEALAELVDVQVPEDPKRESHRDLYWVHSALKDPAVLEDIYTELNIDKVALKVGVGVERSFTTSIPEEIRLMLEAKKELWDALYRGERNIMNKRSRLLTTQRRAGRVTVKRMVDVINGLINGDTFSGFLDADKPYLLGGIQPARSVSFIPSLIDVAMAADLSFTLPAASGNLTFRKKEFNDKIRSDFEDALEP